MNLEKYFERIGFEQKAQPDLETLKRLNYLHTAAIPFENLNLLLKLPVSIDSGEIQKKLISELRSGNCFEHNLLFFYILYGIGFSPIVGVYDMGCGWDQQPA